MAGRKVRNYLSARGFDAFYDLYHGLAERIMSLVWEAGSSSVELMVRLYKLNPDILLDAKACTRLDAYAKLSKDAGLALNAFFWGQPNTDIQDVNLRTRLSVKRWEPFNETAWDSFFNQMSTALETCIQVLRDCHGKLKTYPAGQTQMAERIPELLAGAEMKCAELSKMCDQEGVEFDLFNGWFLARLRHVESVISSATRSIQRSIEAKPGVFRSSFKTDLDVFLTLTNELNELIELYRQPRVIERMLLDRDLLAGHLLPHNEAAWDSIWDSMSQVLGVSNNKLREQFQRLKSHPPKSAKQVPEELTTIEKFLDELSYILLEMTDRAPLTCLSTK